MALQLPRGLYRVDFALLDITTSLPGTAVLSTRPRRLAMTYQADTFDVEGGDVQLEQGENNERYELEFESAGLELTFLAALVGVTLSTSGTGSTLKTTLTKNLTIRWADGAPQLPSPGLALRAPRGAGKPRRSRKTRRPDHDELTIQSFRRVTVHATHNSRVRRPGEQPTGGTVA